MSLFRKRTSDEQPPKVESTPEYVYVPPIDSRVPECPNCKGALKKAPGSKTKCPLCGLYMFVRTDPQTRKRVVVTEAQTESIDDESARLNGTWEARLAEKKRKGKIRADLTKSFKGKEPSKQDIEWRMLNQDSMTYAKSRDWISYMLTKNEMAERQLKSNLPKGALRAFLDVAALAVNGAEDVSSAIGMDAKTRRELDIVEFGPGNPSTLTYIRVDGIFEAMEALGLSLESVLSEFVAICESPRLSKLPLSPAEARDALKAVLSKN
jgi:hypothetical protein